MREQFVVWWNIRKLLKSCDMLERYPEGEPRQAHEILVKIGSRALPALKAKNEHLIAEHQAYSRWLKKGPFSNPYENYALKSDADKRYRYVIEIKQARVVDVIEEIEGAGDSS